jgi:hypothetical protein
MSLNASGEEDEDCGSLSSSSWSSRATRWWRCPHRPVRRRRRGRCRMCALFVFLSAASFAALLLAAGKMFHLSLPNLLRLVFGGRGKRSSSDAASSDVAAVCLSNETNFISISAGDLVMTRSASAFSAGLTSDDDDDDDDDEDGRRITSDGFLWDEEDGRTTRWRPQGVTTFNFNAVNGTRWFVLCSPRA